jgi:catechol 2,3-dioxygenase-like lactoylglutathione lyase family enzyme
MPQEYIDLDHLAVGSWSNERVLGLAASWAGGREVSRFRTPSWAGVQAQFAEGIRLEALQPVEDPADDFLARFLQSRGEGPHHVTFKVPDIEASLARLHEMGIEPVKPDFSDPNWKEMFLHPRLGLGIVVQLAQQGGTWSAEQQLPPLAPDAFRGALLGAEIRSDPDQARRVFAQLLEGRETEVEGGHLYSWPGGGSLLVRPAGEGKPRVERYVFRLLNQPAGTIPPSEEPLFDGPSTVLRLGPGQPWVGTIR